MTNSIGRRITGTRYLFNSSEKLGLPASSLYLKINNMSAIAEIKKLQDLPVTWHPEIVSGAPVFENTRVPVATLFDYLADNYTLDEFIESFPSVTREAALKVLLYGEEQIRRELGT